MHWYELNRSQNNQNRTNSREQLVATAPVSRVLCQVKDHPGTRTDDLVSSGKRTQLRQQAVNPWASSQQARGLLREAHYTGSQNIKYKWPVHPTKQNICLHFFLSFFQFWEASKLYRWCFLIENPLNVPPSVLYRIITTANASVDFLFLLSAAEWIHIVYLKTEMLFSVYRMRSQIAG